MRFALAGVPGERRIVRTNRPCKILNKYPPAPVSSRGAGLPLSPSPYDNRRWQYTNEHTIAIDPINTYVVYICMYKIVLFDFQKTIIYYFFYLLERPDGWRGIHVGNFVFTTNRSIHRFYLFNMRQKTIIMMTSVWVVGGMEGTVPIKISVHVSVFARKSKIFLCLEH